MRDSNKYKEYDDLLGKYIEMFNECWPIYEVPFDIDEQIKIMKECLRTGVPYDPTLDPDYDPDAIYQLAEAVKMICDAVTETY